MRRYAQMWVVASLSLGTFATATPFTFADVAPDSGLLPFLGASVAFGSSSFVLKQVAGSDHQSLLLGVAIVGAILGTYAALLGF